jgi:L-rhamnose mutarotase
VPVTIERISFRLRVRPDRISEYEEAHKRVWPEMLQLLKSVGIEQYSIFRRGSDLFFYMHVADFAAAWSKLDQSSINQRWQKEMAPLFEPLEDLKPGERFPMMKEVFYLE